MVEGARWARRVLVVGLIGGAVWGWGWNQGRSRAPEIRRELADVHALTNQGQDRINEADLVQILAAKAAQLGAEVDPQDVRVYIADLETTHTVERVRVSEPVDVQHGPITFQYYEVSEAGVNRMRSSHEKDKHTCKPNYPVEFNAWSSSAKGSFRILIDRCEPPKFKVGYTFNATVRSGLGWYTFPVEGHGFLRDATPPPGG